MFGLFFGFITRKQQRFPQKENFSFMAELPFPWNIYTEKQEQLKRSNRLTDQTWGIENGLNALLTSLETNSIKDQADWRRDVDRAIDSRFCRERNRARLRRRYLRTPAEFDTRPQRHPADFSTRPMEDHLHARIRLSKVFANSTTDEQKLIAAAAAGFDCKEIAKMYGLAHDGAIRTRLSRLRARLKLHT